MNEFITILQSQRITLMYIWKAAMFQLIICSATQSFWLSGCIYMVVYGHMILDLCGKDSEF